jgi:hypothetical protein
MASVQDEFHFETTIFNFIPSPQNSVQNFLGEDLAQWLSNKLQSQWKTTFGQEDWGWYVEALLGEHKYLIGVYDLRNEADDEDGQSQAELPNYGQWCLRLFNLVDKRSIFKKLFSTERVPVDEFISSQIKSLLQTELGIQEIRDSF